MSNNIFSDDFSISAENPDSGDYGEAVKRHIKTTKANPARLSDEASTYIGLAVFKLLFVTFPLALLLAGLVVVPVTEAIFNAEIGFWTAFLLLLTLRWLIPRPRKSVPLEKLYEQKGL